MNTKLHARRLLLALPLAVYLSAAPHIAAQQPADSGTRFLPPNELRRAMQENYVPDPTPEPTPTPEKNPTLGVEDRIQIQALFSAAESLRSQGKPLEAAAYYQQAAAKGDTTSLIRLADLYAGYEEGMIPDPSRSEKSLRAAAAKNNRTASIRLAEIYRDGIGQKPDAEKAASFYRQAMAPGAPRGAQDEVIAAAAALVLANRKIGDDDFKRILKMVRDDRAGKPAERAAILLSAVAMVEAEKGRQNLIPKEPEDPAKAQNTPQKFGQPPLLEELLADQTLTIDSALAELDQADSDPALPKLQHRAALLLASAPPPAEGTSSRAEELFQAASGADLQAARYRIDKPTAEAIKKNLASTGDYGRSTLADGTSESTDADSIGMIEAAAEAGDPDAQYELGQLWLQGIGRQKNEWRALQAFQKSAIGGNINGIQMLGRCYARGIGTGIDRRKAAHLYSLAAAKGHPEAMYGFAKALENGRGIPQDPVAAASWLTKSADAGVAAANIELAKKALNPESETDRIDIPAAARRYLAAARADDTRSQLEFLKIVFASSPESDTAPSQLFDATGEEILEWSQALSTDKTLTEKQRQLASYYQARCLATGLGTTQDLDQASKLFVTLSGKPLPKPTPEPSPEAATSPTLTEVNQVNKVPTPASIETPAPEAAPTPSDPKNLEQPSNLEPMSESSPKPQQTTPPATPAPSLGSDEPDSGDATSPPSAFADIHTETFKIVVAGAEVEVTRMGTGPLGVIFFGNSDSQGMKDTILSEPRWFSDIVPDKCSFFLWAYPESSPFDKVQPAISAYLERDKEKMRPDFKGIASNVLAQIREKTGLKGWLLVGNSLGAGIILWDYKELESDPMTTFLFVSPTETFMPPVSGLGKLERSMMLAAKGWKNDDEQMRTDSFLKGEAAWDWVASNLDIKAVDKITKSRASEPENIISKPGEPKKTLVKKTNFDMGHKIIGDHINNELLGKIIAVKLGIADYGILAEPPKQRD